MKFLQIHALAIILVPVLAAPEKLSTSIQLTLNTSPWTSLADSLAKTLPPVTLTTVLSADSLTHAGAAQSSPDSPLTKDWRFSAGDNLVLTWYPQGVSSTYDAYDAGTVNGKEAVITSWYNKNDIGVRIGFHHTGNRDYVYALLVEPTTAATKYKTLSGLHAGGIVWYGGKLYVADTSNGFRVFDMTKIMPVADAGHVGLKDGVYAAAGYKYIIPQIARYTQGSGDFRFSFVSLDRTTTPDSILAGEYQESGTAGRIARWDIDYTTRNLSTGKSTEMWRIGEVSIQGAISVNGKYYFTRSRALSKGKMFKWAGTGTTELVDLGNIFPVGPEDLSYMKSTGELWSCGEHPTTRKLWAVKASAL